MLCCLMLRDDESLCDFINRLKLEGIRMGIINEDVLFTVAHSEGDTVQENEHIL